METIRQDNIALDKIFVSPTNPRRHYDERKLGDLANSIKQMGVLQPIIVRARAADAGATWELIFGTRRFRAAALAELEDIPARVVTMTDDEVLDAQAVENGQREDVHPLEEAELYGVMLRPPAGATHAARSVDEIAAKVGKSKAWVYARLKLLELTEKNRERFYAGKLDASTALLLARIPNAELQDGAGREITDEEHGDDDGEPWSYRQAKDYIQRRYMLRLADAPFEVADASLVAAAGACTSCPKRTGNQKELFADVDSADVCTDPTCFEAKKDAAWARRSALDTARGRIVLDATESKKVLPYGDYVAHNAGFVKLDDHCHEDPKNRTYRQLLKKQLDKGVEVTVARAPLGDAVELVTKAGLKKTLGELGHEWAKPEAPAEKAKATKKDAAANLAARLLPRVVMGELVAGIERHGAVAPDLLRVAIRLLADHDMDGFAQFRRLGLDDDANPPAGVFADWAEEQAATMKAPQLLAFLLELALSPALAFSFRDDEIKRVAKAAGVDLAAAKKKAAAIAKAELEKAEIDKVAGAKQAKAGAAAKAAPKKKAPAKASKKGAKK